jgi:DHA3 family tetracycline resistance protein-like MFS transporter
MVYQIETVKLNPLQLVLVGTVLESTCFIFQIPTGVLADVYSRRLAVVIGYTLTGLGFLLEGLIPTYWAVLVGMVLWGIGATLVSGAEEAWCTDEVGEQHVGTAFVRATQIGQVAGLLAIPVGIWLACYHLNLPIVSGASLIVLLGVFLFFCMPEEHFQPTPREERSSWRALGKTVLAGWQAIKRNRMLWMVLGVIVFAAMSSEGFDRLQTDHFIQDFHFPAIGNFQPLIWFGIINAGASILTLIATTIIRRHVDMQNSQLIIKVMLGCNLLLIFGIAAFALAGNFYLAPGAFWLACIGRRAANPLQDTWIARNSEPRTRATVFSMLGQVDAVGQIASGPAIGYIGTIASLRAALLVTSAVLSPCVIFFVGALRLSKQTPTYDNTKEEIVEEVPYALP